MLFWSLPRQRDVMPYRSPGCADVLRVARAHVTDFSYMTLMDKSAVKHNMLKDLTLQRRIKFHVPLLALLETHHILHVSSVIEKKVKCMEWNTTKCNVNLYTVRYQYCD